MNTNPITEKAVELYDAGNGASVEEIAQLLETSSRSIITRLSRANVYVKKPTVAKGETKKRGVKTELVNQINNALETEFTDLKNLSVATLEALLARITTD